MYAAPDDPYCYKGTAVLKNLGDIHDQAALDMFEKAMTDQRSDEPFPEGRFSVAHYRAIHHHLFRDVYPWAGKFRTVRLAKDGNAFCYPEYISREMVDLFAWLRRTKCLRGLELAEFAASAAYFLSTLNAIHPFREGNGRAQLSFLTMIAERAGRPFRMDRLNPGTFLAAMVQSFGGNEAVLTAELQMLVDRR